MAAVDCKFHIIYTITRDDGTFYKGLHSTDDLDDGYAGSGLRVKNWIKKHGIDKFWKRHTKSIDEVLPSRELLEAREAEVITSELLKNPLCLNLSVGGRGGSKFTGKKHTDLAKQKMGAANRGVSKTVEHRAKISSALKGRQTTCGLKHTDETIKRMKASIVSSPARQKFCRPCTIDGITIFESMKSMRRALGSGKCGTGSPSFRYLP
jgi:hypothetical protein